MSATRLVLIITLLFTFGCGITYGQKEAQDGGDKLPTVKSAAEDSIFYEAIRAKQHDDDKLATELFERFLNYKPGSAAAYYELCKLYGADRQKEKAEKYIKKAIDLDNTNKWYQREYASLLSDRGDYDDAADIMAHLVDLDPEDEDLPMLAAEYFERAKKLGKAIDYINKALERNVADPDLQMRKVQLYLELNDVDKATAVVAELIGSDPKNGKYYKVLCELYDNNKMPDKAGEVLAKAIKLMPDDPSVQLGQAEHYLKIGDSANYKISVRKAIINKEFDVELQLKLLEAYLQNLSSDSLAEVDGMPIIRALVSQHPADADVLAFYGDFLAGNNQRDSAMIAYKRSVVLNASRFNNWLKIMQGYTDKKDADSLIRYSEKALKLFPNQAIANYYNGIGHLNKQEYPASIKAINRAIDLQPDAKPELLSLLYSTLGDIYHLTKQYELSDNAFDKSLKYDENDAGVLNNYSYYLSERGQRLDDAEKMSRKSLQIKPGEATFLDTYGWILYKKGDYDGAKDYELQAIKKAGERADGTLYDHLGNIYFKLGDKDKAIENWKLAREKGGGDSANLDKKISEGKLYE